MADITGTAIGETLNDTAENDAIVALGGNDTIIVSLGGTDSVDGGADTDRLVLDARVTGGAISMAAPTANADGLSGSAGWTGAAVSFQRIENFTIHSSAGSFADNVVTGSGDDVFYHYGIDNTSYAADTIDLGAGSNDLLVADFSALITHNVVGYLNFTPGHNLLTVNNVTKIDFTNVERLHLIGSALVDNVSGLVGDDILEGRAGNDTLRGGTGNDRLDGGQGNDQLEGGADDDTLVIINGDDSAAGGTGNDTLIVDYGDATTAFSSVFPNTGPTPNMSGDGGFDGAYRINDTRTVGYSSIEKFDLTTGSGNDTIFTATGNDVIHAGGGDDLVNPGTGLDTVDGGIGTDGITVNLSTATSAIAWNLVADTYSGPVGTGFSGFEYFLTLTTGSGNDVIVTTDLQRHEEFTLGDGDDSLTIRNGDDRVHGGAGTDTLIVDYSNATTVISSFGIAPPAGPRVDPNGGFEGYFGDLINRFTFYDGIEKFVVSTGSANDLITMGTGAIVTDDVVNLGSGDDRVILGRGVDTADGGIGTDGLEADLSQTSTAISIDLNTNSYTLPAGTSFTNFEYFSNQVDSFATGTGNDNVVTRNANLNDSVRLGAGDDSVTVYNGSDAVVGYGLDTPAGGGGFDTLVVDYGAATTAITQDGGFLQANSESQGWDGRLTDGGSRFVYFYGFDRFDITTGSGNDVFNYFNLNTDADNIFHLGGGNDSVNLSQSTGDNYLDGGTGNDTMTGGFGNDIYVVDSASDVVNDFFGGVDEVRTSLSSYTLATDLENLTGTENVNQVLTGNASANVIDGGPGGDALFGLAGNDTLKVTGGTTGANTPAESVDGGAHNDLLIVDYSAMTEQVGLYVASDGAGGATGFADIPDGANRLNFTAVERLQITTGIGNDTVNGFQNDDVINTGAGADLILAGAGNDQLDGGTGADDMRGGDGNDTYVLDDSGDQITEAAGGSSGVDQVSTGLASYTLAANVENLTGTSLAGQTLTGNAGLNIITGAAGNDILIGGRGDTLSGNGGNDRLELSGFGSGAGMSLAQGGASGTDTLRVDFSAYAGAISTGIGSDMDGGSAGAFMDPAGMFPMNILVSFSSIENFDITGSASDDTLTSGAGADFIDGGAGADAMTGGAGDDVYVVGDAGDTVTETADAGTDTVRTNLAGYSIAALDNVENLTGTSLAGQSLTGNGGANIIAGAAGADTMAGGDGDDTYVVIGADTVVEAEDEGFDQVYASTSFTLGAGAEVEVVAAADSASTAALNFYGNEYGQAIFGNAGANVLAGGGGADALYGRGGDDIYSADVEDVVVENAGEGFDQVYALASFTLNAGAEVEVVAAGDPASTAAQNLYGNEFGQSIIGNAGANTLVGGGGADGLYGRGGDDIYSADVEDVVVEYANEGFDQVYALASFTLNAGAEVEVVAAGNSASTAALNLYGNEFGQQIIGNAGANILVGGGGADGLYGLAGDDIYSADGQDVVVENAGQGFDQVYALASFTLNAGAEVEVIATGDSASSVALNLYGNEFGQQIIGNAGANILVGGGGADGLYGLAGDDIYSADGQDVVVENAGQGFDQVYALATFALNADAEVEVIAAGDSGSTAALNLTGNEYGQQIIGNAGANILDGGGGADSLSGGAGADSFAFTTALGGGNIDTIAGFSAADDSIALDDAVFTGLGLGVLSANAFVVGAAAADADDRIVYNQATGQLLFDADGNGAGAAVHFATLQGSPAITESDFTVI